VVNAATEVDKTFVRLFRAKTYYDLMIKKMISGDWLKLMIPYLDIDIIYQPFVDKGVIFANLQPRTSSVVDDELSARTINYTKIYTEIIESIQEQVRTMYEYAFVADPPSHIISNWSLVQVFVEDDQLYAPNWDDDRITRKYGDIYSFIQTRMRGNTYMKFIIPHNMVKYHYLSKYLDLYFPHHKYTITDGMLYIDVNNLKTATDIADIIELVEYDSDGDIIPTYSSSIYEAELYLDLLKSKYGEDVSIAVYEQEDSERPIVVSLLIPLDSYINKGSIRYDIHLSHIDDMIKEYYEEPEIRANVEYDVLKYEKNKDNGQLMIEGSNILNDMKAQYLNNLDFVSSIPTAE
jgi:hypothetical protein